MTELPNVKMRDSAGADRWPRFLAGSVPESDPAYPIIAAILRVVPASRWVFAHLEAGGELGPLLDSQGNADEIAELNSEFLRQREKAKVGPRIAAMVSPLGDYESGITLLFANAHAKFGILTLLRSGDLGPFTSSEISVLAFALDATSERLAALRLNAPAQAQPGLAERRSEGAFYVLDQDLKIVLARTEDHRRVAQTNLPAHVADRLPAVLEEAVRELTAGWRSDPATQEPGIARPAPFLVVRTQPMSGPAGVFIGVRIDRFRPPNLLSGPAARYHISPRELQVLGLLLDGDKLEEIGKELHITTSTVQDHIKSMVDKTGSRNRTELIARILGWETNVAS